MIHLEAWHMEAAKLFLLTANERRRLQELLRLLSSRDESVWGGIDREEVLRELAKLVGRLRLKEIPESLPEETRREVFLRMFPRFMDDLRGVVLAFTSRSAREVLPYYRFNDRITQDIMHALRLVEQVGQAWDRHETPSLVTMRNIQEALADWNELFSPPLPPREGIPEGQPFVDLKEVALNEGIYLPSWLELVIPGYDEYYDSQQV